MLTDSLDLDYAYTWPTNNEATPLGDGTPTVDVGLCVFGSTLFEIPCDENTNNQVKPHTLLPHAAPSPTIEARSKRYAKFSFR